MTPRVGYYVHHHGRGHLSRATAITSQTTSEVTIFSSLDCHVPNAVNVRLPMDTTGPDFEAPVPRQLHYSPIGRKSVSDRMAAIAEWATEGPAVLVVDVSVEVTVFARLCSLAPIVIRQHGRRDDEPHRHAYDCATSLLAPYSSTIEDPSVPAWVRDKTTYVGGFSRLDADPLERSRTPQPSGAHREAREVLVLAGTGGAAVPAREVRAAAEETPGWRWTVVGPSSESMGSAVRHVPWTDDVHRFIVAADVVIAGAGDGVVNEVMSCRRPLVCIPETRPFDEQTSKAQLLDDAGAALAVTGWDAARPWMQTLERALALDLGAQALLVDGRGAARAAAHVDGLAAELVGD